MFVRHASTARSVLDTPPGDSAKLQLIPAISAGLGVGSHATVPTVLGPSICKVQGVVAQVATDFSMSELLFTSSSMPLASGVAAVVLSNRAEALGMRRLGLASSSPC